MENRKLVVSSVGTKNVVETVAIEQKSGMCVTKCRSGTSSNLGNGASVAMKGKLAAIRQQQNLL